MDDQFLHDFRRQPAPEFATRLRVALRDQVRSSASHVRTSGLAKWLSAAASIAVVSFAFTFPAVRAGAEAFLDLFRVASVRGVQFDAQRLRELASSGFDLPALFGDVETLTEPQAPVSVATAAEAGAMAGVGVLAPAWLPPGWTSSEIEVSGEHRARVTASKARLQGLLDALGLDDVRLPEGLDGQVATLHVPPIVATTYRNGDGVLRLIQARSPDVSFPAGLDLSVLAEAGLRILGLDRDEAYRLAYNIDWRNTLIVPVPLGAASFRQVNVAGNDGLVIENAGGEPRGEPFAGGARRASGSLLLWSAGGQVFALGGPLPPEELLEIAQTLQ